MMPPLLEAALQAWITITAIVALVLMAPANERSRWGHLVGILGQPAWLFSTWVHGQFGMFLASIAFTAVYLWGIWHFWILPLFDHPPIIE